MLPNRVRNAGGLSLQRGLDGIGNGVESGRISNGNLAQHFSVKQDVGLLAAVDELAVTDTSLFAGGTQPGDP